MTHPRLLSSLLVASLLVVFSSACSDPASDDPEPGIWETNNDNNDDDNNATNNGTSNNGASNNDTSNNDNNIPADAGNNGNNGEPDVAPDAPEDAPTNNHQGDADPDTPDNNGGNNSGALVVRSCATAVEYRGAGGSVAISGPFTTPAWDTSGIALQQEGGVWRTELTLEPGNYPYKFIIDGTFESSVPVDVYTQWDGDVENRSLRVADCHKPEWRAIETRVGEDGMISGSFQFARATEGSPLDPSSVTLSVGGQATSFDLDPSAEVVSFSMQASALGKYSIRLSGADQRGVDAENNPFYLPLWYEAEPFAWQDAMMYLIFTDRFRDTDNVDHRISGAEERANYLGGDFRGVIEAIEEGYFEAMGINALWLSPIYDNTDNTYPDKNNDPSKMMTGFHGYWPISLAPEPRYGDAEASAEERLEELTRVAHAHGIRILFDLALNHVHEDHPYCQENPSWCSQTCICGSDNCGWDPFNARGLDCQFDTFLPDLSYRNHAILERVVSDTMAMIEKYDVDGLRIDAARHMDHVIMRTLRMTLRDKIEANGGAPYYTVGETFTDNHGEIMAFVADHELHGQFDFFTRTQIRNTFVFDGSFEDLDNAMAFNESPSGYGEAVRWMSPFFGNHDIDRIATVIAFGNDHQPWGDTPDLMAAGPADTVDQWNIINRMSMAFAFLYTYKGIPLTYYGDEIGLAGSRDPDNRRQMFWDLNANQRELLSRVRALGRARRELAPLRRGERQELWRDQNLYVYIRSIEAGDGVIVAMNKGATRTESVQVPASYGLEGVTLESFNSDRSISVTNGAISLNLDSWEYAIFRRP